MSAVYIIDDDQALCRSLQLRLQELGHEVAHAPTAAEALDDLSRRSPDLILLDVSLPDQSGLEVLRTLQERGCRTPVAMITGRQDTLTTITAMRDGAFDYLRKPFDLDDVLLVLEKIAQVTRRRTLAVLPVYAVLEDPHQIVGADRKILEAVKDIGRLSTSRVNVLVEGESGTGKELVARALHRASSPDEPFIAINCSAIVATLPESELFGHEKGSFTGADSRKIGKLEYAGAGTVFLDEVGDLSAGLQAKLLRVLQEREFQRVGGLTSIPFVARVVAATNRDLDAAVGTGAFRSDLFYRLAVSRVRLPALRDRRGDIPLLVTYLLPRISRRVHRHVAGIEERALALLQQYDWPGNVRELENVLTRAIVLSPGDIVTAEQLRPALAAAQPQAAPSEDILPLSTVEQNHILRALAATGWNITRTAQMLKISPTTLRKKIADYGLRDPR